jgi:hypothetical protein
MNNKNEFQQIMEKLDQILSVLKKLSNKNTGLESEEMMDNHDMCALLGITKRTLQRYRQKGIVPYYMMSGKPYYKPSEVRECLKRIWKNNNNNLNIK